jgi:hypothetical protein
MQAIGRRFASNGLVPRRGVLMVAFFDEYQHIDLFDDSQMGVFSRYCCPDMRSFPCRWHGFCILCKENPSER